VVSVSRTAIKPCGASLLGKRIVNNDVGLRHISFAHEHAAVPLFFVVDDERFGAGPSHETKEAFRFPLVVLDELARSMATVAT
jgi:hypothetical protein